MQKQINFYCANTDEITSVISVYCGKTSFIPRIKTVFYVNKKIFM